MSGQVIDPVDRVQHELALIGRRSERMRLAALEAVGSPLDHSGFLLLGRLIAVGDTTMLGLAEAFELDASTVSTQVAPLERRGYVTRSRSDVDRRETIVAVTESGRAEYELVRVSRRDHVESRLKDWAVDDVGELASVLGRLNATLVSSLLRDDETRQPLATA